MARGQKLNNPYRPSQKTAAALREQSIQKAAAAKNVAGADKQLKVPEVARTVEDAITMAGEMGGIVRDLRAARRPRGGK